MQLIILIIFTDDWCQVWTERLGLSVYFITLFSLRGWKMSGTRPAPGAEGSEASLSLLGAEESCEEERMYSVELVQSQC